MSEIRVTSVVGENGGDRVGLTTGLTVGPLTGTTGIGATITHHGHAQFAGVCTATSFVGNGANLTSTPSWTTVASFDCASANPSALEVTGLNNPQVIMYVFHELRHSASSRNVMQIGNDSTGYQASGYFDIGTYRTAGAVDPASTRGHNQAQWYPLDYNFTVNTNLYSGKLVLTRTFNRWSYESSIDVSYTGSNTQYEIMWRGHNRNFSSAFNRVKIYNNSGGTYNSGYVTILTQS